MFEFPVNAHWTAAGMPQYGQQDVGVTPGGALDLFAHQTGQILLGNEDSSDSVEFIFPLRCRVRANGWVVLTGAPRKSFRLCTANGTVEAMHHGQVIRVTAGEDLEFSEQDYGLRSYLSWRKEKLEGDALNPEGRKRGAFADRFSWPDPEGRFRCLPGPEWSRLQNPELIEAEGWQVSSELSHKGIRLEHASGMLDLSDSELISGAVADGTVQLTPSGPFALLRHRQTLGGYPRILNIISADVDLLAQLAPGQGLRFKFVDEEEGRELARLKCRELEEFQQSFSI
jgi:allophanate hydrolase subunit 2